MKNVIIDRDAFIEKAIDKAILAGKPLLASVARKEAYQNFCEIFREDKREEGAHVANACLEIWALRLNAEFKRNIKSAKYAHIFDWGSPEAKRDIARRKYFIQHSEQD